MTRTILLLILFLLPFAGAAQTPSSDSLQRDVNADPRLKTAISKHTEINSKAKMKGYRIQLHSSGDQEKAKAVKSRFLSKYASEIHAYQFYDSPNFKVRVGDFRTHLEAYQFLQKIKAEYPQAFIVECEIEKPQIR